MEKETEGGGFWTESLITFKKDRQTVLLLGKTIDCTKTWRRGAGIEIRHRQKSKSHQRLSSEEVKMKQA